MKKYRLPIILSVLGVLVLAGIIAIISNVGRKPEHVHSYTEWKYDVDQHWKVCPEDGEKDETSVADHIFIAGECECGAHKEAEKYGTVKGKVVLRKLGGLVNDFTGITVDMGDDDVEITGTATDDGYEFTVTNVKVGKFYNLTISKLGYQSYSTEVLLEKENEEAKIGGEKGVTLGYEVFGLLCGYDAEYHDFSKVNDDDPCIIFKEHPGTKTMNVLTKDSFTNVSATMGIKLQNSTANMHTQGIVLKFEDGKHVVVRYHNGDLPNGRIQYCNNAWDVCKAEDSLLTDAGLDQWGEKALYTLTDAETTACNGDGVDLTVVVKDGKVYSFFNGKCLDILQLPAGYADKKVQVGYFAWDTANDAVFNYAITEVIPALPSKPDVTAGDPGTVSTNNSVFDLLAGYDAEYHDFSKVGGANPCIIFKEHPGDKTMNVLTKASYNDVSASLNIKYNNSTFYMHTQGIVLKFEDGKHLVIRYHNGDLPNGNIQYCDNAWDVCKSGDTLFGNAGLNQWGEKPVYTLTDQETTAIKAGGLNLNVVLKGGKLYTFFNGKCVATYDLPAGYANKKVKVGYFAWNTANNAVFNYSISKTLPALPADPVVQEPSAGNDVFNFLENYDTEYHDFSKANGDNPCIIFKEHPGDKTMNVLTKDSYNNVSASLNIKYNNSTYYMHTQGIVLKFEDGKHLVVRYHNGDMVNGNIQYCDNAWSNKTENTLFGADAGLNQWGENPVYTLTDQETAAIKADGLNLNVVLKDGKLYTLFNGRCVASYSLPAGYANKKVQVGYFAWNTANNAVFNYAITDDAAAMQSALKIDVTSPEGMDCTVTAEPKKNTYAFGDQITLTFSAPEGCKLETLKVCGVDRLGDVENGKLTITADRLTLDVQATFAKEKPISLDLTVRGKKLGTLGNLAEGTVVTFKSAGGEQTFTVGADGKLHVTLAKGAYKVSAAGYLVKDITVDESLTELVLEYDTFKDVLGWGDFDFSKQNEAEPEIGITNDCSMIYTNDTYDDVVATIYLKGNNMNKGNAGILFRFVGEDMNDTVFLRLENMDDGRRKIQFVKEHTLWTDFGAKHGISLAEGSDWDDLIFFSEGDEYFTECDAGTLKLTAVRKGATVYVFLNDHLVGQRTFAEKYANAKCEAGFIAEKLDNNSEWIRWKVQVSENLPAVQVTNETVADAHGKVEIAPADVKFNDTVTITVTPDSGYRIAALTVNGTDVTKDLENNKYELAACEAITVKAEFVEITTGSIHAEISGKKHGVTGNALTAGTAVELTAGGLDPITATLVEENGKIMLNVPELTAAKWTVKVAGYETAEITVAKSAEYQEVIVLEYDTFRNIIKENWVGSFDFTKQNDTEAQIGITNDCCAIATKDTYDEVVASIYLKGDMQQGNAGIFFRFVGDGMNDVAVLRIQGRKKVQFADTYNMWGSANIADGTGWQDLIFFEDVPQDNGVADAKAAEYLAAYDEGTLKLTAVRKGATIYVFLGDRFIGSRTFAEKYANAKCEAGFVTDSLGDDKTTMKYWKVEVSETIPDLSVTVKNETAADANGNVEITPADVQLGDEVTVIVTPNEGYMLDKLEVSGGAALTDHGNGKYTFKAMEREYVVAASFMEKPATEAQIQVSGIGMGNTPVDMNGERVVLKPAEGTPVTLVVENGEIKGVLAAGTYTAKVDGFYDIENVEVDATGNFTATELAFEKKIFHFNIHHSNGTTENEGNLGDKPNVGSSIHAASQGVISATGDGKIYEWTIDEYQDSAITVTLKSGNGNQGVIIQFGDTQNVVRLRFENTKAQWVGGDWPWWWGTSCINNTWDFGDGNAYANPMRQELLDKYDGEGLKLTIARRGGTVYALIDGQVYATQSVGTHANEDIRFGVFVEDAKAGYEIPFIIEDTDDVLARTGQVFSSTPDSADLSHLSEGKVIATGNGGVDLVTIERYLNVTAEAKFDVPDYTPRRYSVALVFEDGKNFRVDFAVLDGNKDNIFQATDWGNSILGWATLHTYTEDDIKNNFMQNGLTYKLERVGAEVKLYINDELMQTYTLPDGYKDQQARLKFVYDSNGTNGNTGFTFTINEPVAATQSEATRAAAQAASLLALPVLATALRLKKLLVLR